MRSVWLVAMVSLAVSYNAKDILFRGGGKNFVLFYSLVISFLSGALCFCS